MYTNLTISESKKFSFLRSEIEHLSHIIIECDKYLDFLVQMKDFFLLYCRDLEEEDRESIRQEIELVERIKNGYKERINSLYDLCTGIDTKKHRLYNQYYRVNRFI